MGRISDHHSSATTKLLFIGDSGAGKTGALAALAAEGYSLRIIDTDNGLDILKDYLTNPESVYFKKNPKAAETTFTATLTEEMKDVAGELVPAKATVWPRITSLLNNWKDPEDESIQLGKITTWGPKDILVIDSLSSVSAAAVNYILALNGKLLTPNAVTQNEGRRYIYQAQEKIRTLLYMLYDKSVKCNVIVTAHVTFVSETGGRPQVDEKGILLSTPQGYPSAIGRALSPHIPRWFNSMLIAKTEGVGNTARHKIFTRSQLIGSQIVNAKSSAPLKVKTEYPLDWGLAQYFQDVRGKTGGSFTPKLVSQTSSSS